MGIAGMILGILAAVFAIIPIFGWIISIPCLLVGLPLSITLASFRIESAAGDTAWPSQAS